MAINDGGRNKEKYNHHGKRNGGGRLRKIANFSGDFPEGRDPCGSCDGDEIRKTKHNHAATNRKNRTEEQSEMKNKKMLEYCKKNIEYLMAYEKLLKSGKTPQQDQTARIDSIIETLEEYKKGRATR